jgi:hypothetical protein
MAGGGTLRPGAVQTRTQLPHQRLQCASQTCHRTYYTTNQRQDNAPGGW